MTEKKESLCMVCAKPSESSICDSCKSQIQGEAADKKQKMEKSVSVGSEVEKDRRTKHGGD
jgi:predicted amidophosphoribosyltransferase